MTEKIYCTILEEEKSENSNCSIPPRCGSCVESIRIIEINEDDYLEDEDIINDYSDGYDNMVFNNNNLFDECQDIPYEDDEDSFYF